MLHALLTLKLAGTLVAGLPSAGAVGITARATRIEVVTPPDSVREYRGVYETGFEKSWFRPCDTQASDELWWVTLTDAALHQRDSLAKLLTTGTGPVYVRWRGTISARMMAGHMGRGTRYMLVSEVLEVRRAGEASCATA
jgi:hypothetical protein